jgi:hypothetical protein
MGHPHLPDPVLLVVAAFSRHDEALAWGRSRLESTLGPVDLASFCYEFNQTAYYEPTMGTGLRKCFLVFRDLVTAEQLPDVKQLTNNLERELSCSGVYSEARPLNLDPGILTLGKFLLATTKDQAHRVYLRDGIFVEVTLRFHHGAFEPWPWTYADYRLPQVLAFLRDARDYYRRRLLEEDTKRQTGTREAHA